MTATALDSARERQMDLDRKIWLDGTLVPWAEATVHVLSHSLQRGSLVFDYMTVHETPAGTMIFRLPEHITRLFSSADLVGLTLPYAAEVISDAIVETVRANPGARSVKVSAFIPSIEVDVVPLDSRVSLAIAAYDPTADVNERKDTPPPPRPETLRIWIEKRVKNRRADILAPQAKASANYASPMVAKWRARQHGYDEILLVDEDGGVAEGPTSNVFLVDDGGGLRTPALDNVLAGVTRDTILQLAKHEGIPVAETRITPDDLFDAREVFLTGATAGVWPVASIDGQPVGEGAPGPVAARLHERFLTVVSGGDPHYAHWLTPVDGATTNAGEA